MAAAAAPEQHYVDRAPQRWRNAQITELPYSDSLPQQSNNVAYSKRSADRAAKQETSDYAGSLTAPLPAESRIRRCQYAQPCLQRSAELYELYPILGIQPT